MTITTMHFGPEWMRAKPQPAARLPVPPSPPPSQAALPAQQPTASTYSSLVTSVTQEQDKHDESRPFRYTKEELLRIYRESGGKAGLGLEVERWEGIVREVASEPISLREMDDTERKLFAGPLNSEHRRRPQNDLITAHPHPSDRPRLSHALGGGVSGGMNTGGTGIGIGMGLGGGGGSGRERFGPLGGRKKECTDSAVPTSASIPRKLSLSTAQGGGFGSASREALPSPRGRMGAFGAGFDGVFSGGNSWSRKRPSVHLTGSGPRKDGESKQPEVKEEEETRGASGVHGNDGQLAAPDAAPDLIPDMQPSASPKDPLAQCVAGVSLEDPTPQDASEPVVSTVSPMAGPPPGLPDPMSVEWSYLDPQGQVQGPFRADVMQKWFDGGYFSPDLLMKRTHLDADWIPVVALERRANGGKVFLSQPSTSTSPPGLSVHTESPQNYSPALDHSPFNGYQPVPQRAIRGTTLDVSYLSNATPSDSPSSSLGAGRFSDGSSEPSAFSGRTGNNAYSNDSNFGARGLAPRPPFQDPAVDSRMPFHAIPPQRSTSLDSYGNYHGGGLPWLVGTGPLNQGFSTRDQDPFSNGYNGVPPNMMASGIPVNETHVFNQEPVNDMTYTGISGLGSHHNLPLAVDTNGLTFNNGPQYGALGQPHYPQTPSSTLPPTQPRQPASPFGEVLTHVSNSPRMPHAPASAVQHSSASSPWSGPSPIRRTKTSEAPAAPSPIAPSPIAPSPVAPSPVAEQALGWGQAMEPKSTPQPEDPSPWVTASLGGLDDVWKEVPGPNSLTFSNVGQHNKLHEQQESQTAGVAVPLAEAAPGVSVDPPAPKMVPGLPETAPDTTCPDPATTPAATSTEPQPAPKAKRKSTVRDNQMSAVTQKVVPISLPAIVKSPSPTPIMPAAPKSVWSTGDDTRKTESSAPKSLREIQEAEAKKAEARKERERLARVNTNTVTATAPTSSSEEAQPFTTAWGLPTSQVGARNVSVTKDTPTSGSTATAPSPLVWTTGTPASAAKKTMKEIQEEEERRKVTVVKDSVASAASRRAYSETAFKVVSSAQSTSGPGVGAWSTVGANGKASTPVVPPSRAPAAPPSATAQRPNGTAARPAAAPAKPAVAPRAEDLSTTPSHDFLRWLSESLKGLNGCVNLEEITAMLLSFPLDPDPSTVEIISDLIYANSTTLDGRRFASEYVSKRKADAALRSAGGAAGTGGKQISIVDVAKIQPKSPPQEWGFKVVNKKKKGGRT